MKRIFKSAFVIYLFSVSVTGYAADVPVTSLTKSCKPLVDKSLRISQPPITGMPAGVHKRITRAQLLMAEDNYAEGIEVLKKLEASTNSNFIKATVNIQLAYAYAQSAKQIESFPFFKKALDLGEKTLPHLTVQSLRENVAGLMYTINEKDTAAKLLEDWLAKSNTEKASVLYLLSVIYQDPDVSKLKESVCPAYFAAKVETNPKKSFFQLLLSVHWQLKDMEGTADILKKMVEYFPEEDSFWRQLSQIYTQLDKGKESLAVMEMFYLRGKFSTETDYKFLSSLFSYEEVPFRSAQILEEGINKGIVKPEAKNWRIVAQNYHVSNQLDKAINAYGEAAEKSSDGKSYLKQAELYSDKEKWGLAIKSFDRALSKGDLDDVGFAYLRKGIALISQGRCDVAFNVLTQASKYKKHRKQSMQWTNYGKDRQKNKRC